VYEVDVKEARNYEFLKKFFALIKKGHDNTKMDMPQEAYRSYCIIKAGFADFYETGKGIMILPKSISFSKMTEETFQDLYSRVLDVIVADLQLEREELLNELGTFI